MVKVLVKKSTESTPDIPVPCSAAEQVDEVSKLLDLKRKYRADCDALETELILKKQKEEHERKESVNAEYVEKLAAVFAERIKPLLLEILKS